MASPKAALLLLAAMLLLSCCYASRPRKDTGGETQEEKAAVTVPMSTNPATCNWMVPCSVDKCTQYCLSIGLGNERGFCSFHNLKFNCCCPVVPPKIPVSSDVKQA